MKIADYKSGIGVLVLFVILGFVIFIYGYAPAKKAEHQGDEPGKKILFYRNPMNPQITSPVFMKDEMGMDYIPVYQKESGAQDGEITISPDEETLAGVKTERVEQRRLIKEIQTVGTVAYDPDLYVAQEEYVGVIGLGDAGLIEAGKRRLRVLGLNDEQIEKLQNAGQAQTGLILPEDKIWVYITIYENEMGLVKEGALVEIEAVAFPGESFFGKIAAVSPVVDPLTRTIRARAEIVNPGQKLKPGMFTNVKIRIDLGRRLAVAQEAVLNTGKRMVVVVAKDNGQYISRDIRLGQKAAGYYEVVEGLKEGELTVTTGNFLIDSESRLQSTQGEHQH